MVENVKLTLPILVLLMILGFGLRITQLGAIGFAEDEMNKLDAIHAYERGDFTANSEHPMMMKVLMWVSLRGIPASSEEAALRFPNALIGALRVIPLFLLTAALFDRWHGLLAAAFWAAGINAITHNRIGKEDTLVAVFVGGPALTAFAHGPHYALYTNALAAGRVGYFFPHDEFYDDGLREAIRYVCEVAPKNATIANETPAVTRHYLKVFGRTDLNSQAISSKEFDVRTASGPLYVIAQRGRTYFENRDELDHVRAQFRRVHDVNINGTTAVEVFANY